MNTKFLNQIKHYTLAIYVFSVFFDFDGQLQPSQPQPTGRHTFDVSMYCTHKTGETHNLSHAHAQIVIETHVRRHERHQDKHKNSRTSRNTEGVRESGQRIQHLLFKQNRKMTKLDWESIKDTSRIILRLNCQDVAILVTTTRITDVNERYTAALPPGGDREDFKFLDKLNYPSIHQISI